MKLTPKAEAISLLEVDHIASYKADIVLPHARANALLYDETRPRASLYSFDSATLAHLNPRHSGFHIVILKEGLVSDGSMIPRLGDMQALSD